jgi:hypothetical protein
MTAAIVAMAVGLAGLVATFVATRRAGADSEREVTTLTPGFWTSDRLGCLVIAGGALSAVTFALGLFLLIATLVGWTAVA